MKNKKRRLLTFRGLLLSCILSSLFLPTHSLVAGNAGSPIKGNGTPTSPYLIETVEELRAIELDRFAFYKLTRNLKLTKPWAPLCANEPFEGVLDGNDFAISDLKVTAGKERGLFAQIGKNGRVSKLALQGVVRSDSDVQAIGGLAGVSLGVISEVACNVEMTIGSNVSSTTAIGGIVGINGGIVAFSAFEGSIKVPHNAQNAAIGAIVGEANKVVANALPTLFTAHAGFAAKGGVKDSSEDNTLKNIIKAVSYRPDVVEVDVQAGPNGDLVITHNAPKADSPTLKSVFQVLLGQLPDEMKSVDLNVEYAKATRIQLDFKKDGLVKKALDEIAESRFPLNRVIMAGDNKYETILSQADAIKAVTKEGLEFWMNPDRIDSYDSLTAKSDKFLEKARSFGFPTLTVNSYYGAISQDVETWLTDNGLQISVWTLNDDASIRGNILRNIHNATSRLPKALEIRNECREKGVYGNKFDGTNLVEIGTFKVQDN